LWQASVIGKRLRFPFLEGNKRVGAVAALVFLLLNGYAFDATEEDFAELVLAVARGELDKAQKAVFIRSWCRAQ
jgi:death-on-curing protein